MPYSKVNFNSLPIPPSSIAHKVLSWLIVSARMRLPIKNFSSWVTCSFSISSRNIDLLFNPDINAFSDHFLPASIGINANDEGAMVGTQNLTGGVNLSLVEWLGMCLPL